MGKGVQSTILIALIIVSWGILNSPIDATFFGINLDLVPVLIYGSLIIIGLAVIALLFLALSEIPKLTPNIARRIEEIYNSIYTACVVVSIGTIILQLYFYLAGFVIDFLVVRTKDWWQIIFLILFAVIVSIVLNKLKVFKK